MRYFIKFATTLERARIAAEVECEEFLRNHSGYEIYSKSDMLELRADEGLVGHLIRIRMRKVQDVVE